MAQTVNIDAMIPRADFRDVDDHESSASKKISDISLSQLTPDSFLVPSLRKPDFQRETTQWTPDQIVKFLESFLDDELVPSVILWKSKTYYFVIDGAHRMSALLAWINDDYGDGVMSKNLYGDDISEEQKRIATRLRNKVRSTVGSFADMKKVMLDSSKAGTDARLLARAASAKTRSIDLQWVEGDAEKAEASFFNINKQGTPLHATEERLLRNRDKPIAIASRSIARAGAGHKYWSSFEETVQQEIEEKSREVHGLLFSPELSFPIKTLNLPHGGQSSPLTAYNLLMDFLAFSIVGHDRKDETKNLYQSDQDGSATIEALNSCIRVLKRMTSNESKSLGLHPAVFFYSERGRHLDTVFLGFAAAIAKAVRNNDSSYFKKFTANRELIEKVFVDHKFLLYQANSLFGSKQRVTRWQAFFEKIVAPGAIKESFRQSELLVLLDLKDKVIAESANESGKAFTSATKSAIFLQKSLDSATRCPECGGRVHVEKAIQYDHIKGKATGGMGTVENGQITHPFCNSIKN
ncbi:DUF262 multi-domain protein [Sulfitobacter noctilucicola]|uniref:HNH endonuclease n=1 Tax=Sulfitobacter noctilucicola TaxID=1342301 RepID=A0A7W6M989_9RHOB|nr:HNH endonuclease signature motif containing protein [Sulfitobacter noctilucicola]KIN64403.1 DUF262 multi-domain protein [Sulfitobacter noctilucicola]MBB4174438.1 hypothetical protein [Sulfitobacter noctilucicola]